MKSSIKGFLVAGAISLIGLVSAVSAQGVNNVYSQYNPPYNTSFNYMMGTVSLNMVQPQTTQNPVNQTVNNPVTVNNTCAPFITTYNKFGMKSEEVAKLQQFLNEYNGANLNGLGYYGRATQQEVKNLQYTYGIKPTGAQYEKTTALINSLKCGNIERRVRVVYTGQSIPAVSVPFTGKVYPSPTDNAPAPITKSTKTSVTKSPTDLASTSSGTKSFLTDFDRIKDNYKAYLLVFFLVLALFWFLRKASNE